MDTKINAAEKPEFKPANDNPWYWLATLYGEWNKDSELDGLIALKNRTAWNRWFAKALSGKQHDELLKRGFLREDLVPWSPTEEAELAIDFTARCGRKDQSLPDPTIKIDFSYTIFDSRVFLNGFRFPNVANFTAARFAGDVDFNSATFSEYAAFDSATFAGNAIFKSATFSKNATFYSVTFSGDANFYSVTFSGDTNFYSTTFSRETPIKSPDC